MVKKKKKKKKMYYVYRRRFSCPECGYTKIDENNLISNFERKLGFDCPRCKSHFDEEEFLDENWDKYDKTAKLDEE